LYKLHHAVHAVFLPYQLWIHRFQIQFDFFPMKAVKHQNRGVCCFADDRDQVDPQVVEDQTCAAHAGDVISAPSGRKSCEHQAVRAGKDRASEDSDSDIQGVVFSGKMQAQIYRAKKSTQRIALDAVETCSGIHDEDLQSMVQDSLRISCRGWI
jgi:hypothetical protein